VAAAKRQLQGHSAIPKTINKNLLSDPLPKAPPTGKKAYYIANTNPDAARGSNGFKAAAAAALGGDGPDVRPCRAR
jgi:hypothetical protein